MSDTYNLTTPGFHVLILDRIADRYGAKADAKFAELNARFQNASNPRYELGLIIHSEGFDDEKDTAAILELFYTRPPQTEKSEGRDRVRKSKSACPRRESKRKRGPEDTLPR